ncbi:MAG: peptidylprolyl isomerase [Methylacidiphilales bacterium]|nr:peptidylprolyl isomerase [Candidatus Methylacidiphilales bacterium]
MVALSFAWAPRAMAADPVVVVKTSMGEIDIQLDPKNAPATTANFLAYVKNKFYDGTIFHRIIPGFVVQGGGFTADMNQKPTMPPIKNEASNGLHNLRGTISMARTNDPNSATSQFFLNLLDNTSTGKTPTGDPTVNLDPGGVSPDGYAVFGKITKGLDVLDKMAKVQTTTVGPYENVPVTPVMLISARMK